MSLKKVLLRYFDIPYDYEYSMYSMYCTVPKVIDFPRYNMKCSRENVILREIVHAVSRFPLHFMLYRENLDCFLTVRGIDEQSEQSQQTKNRQQLYLVRYRYQYCMGTTVPTKHILATKLSDKTVLEFRGTAKLTESQSCFDFAGIAKKK